MGTLSRAVLAMSQRPEGHLSSLINETDNLHEIFETLLSVLEMHLAGSLSLLKPVTFFPEHTFSIVYSVPHPDLQTCTYLWQVWAWRWLSSCGKRLLVM